MRFDILPLDGVQYSGVVLRLGMSLDEAREALSVLGETKPIGRHPGFYVWRGESSSMAFARCDLPSSDLVSCIELAQPSPPAEDQAMLGDIDFFRSVRSVLAALRKGDAEVVEAEGGSSFVMPGLGLVFHRRTATSGVFEGVSLQVPEHIQTWLPT